MAMKIEFALVSVRTGRASARKRIEKGERIPITLTGYLVSVWGRDDGIDQEFSMEVDSHIERPE